MSNLTPIQVIRNTRNVKAIKNSYCDEEIRHMLLNITKALLNDVCDEKYYRVDGCYTYDLFPRIVKEEDGLKHVILDFNYYDYLIDFLCYCNSPDIDHFNYVIFKYSFEINYKRNELAWSYFSYKHMKKCDVYNVDCKNSSVRNDSMVVVLFTILHELTHINPNAFGKQEYEELFENIVNLDTAFLNYDKKGYNVKEEHCDFIAMYIILLSNLFKELYNYDNSILFDLCLKSIIALEFLTLITEMDFNNFINFIESAKVFNRFNSVMTMIIVMKECLNLFDDIDVEKVYNNNVDLLKRLLDNISLILSNIMDEIVKFNTNEELDLSIDEWKRELANEDKETWFCIEYE